MKIIFVTPYFSPSVGGVQQYVGDLIDAYKKSHEIVVVTTQLDKTQSMHEVIDGVTIYRLPVLCKIANTPYHPSWKRHLRSIYAREKPDVINAHAPVPWLADVAERANNDAIPFVVTYHSGSMKKGSLVIDGVISMYERFVLPKTIRSATRVVAIYPDFIRRLVGENHPIAHITPGIDTEFFHINDVDMQYDMLFAGRLEKSSAWKGLDVALRAVAELVKKGQNVTFAIVGDGDARAKYEQLSAQLGIDNHVVFLGPLTHSELTKTYSVSKLIVLPSTTESESFGMVVAEAASCGVPAIGSNIGGIPYVINDHTTGLLVEPGNHTAFATAISQLLTDDQLRKRYGKAARKRVIELFSKNKMSELTLKTFQEAAHQQYPKTLQVVAYYPPALGGMERVAENIAIELAETGTPTEVVTSDIGYTPGYVDQAKPNYTVTRLQSAMIGGLPIIPSLLLHLLRQPKKSLYHVHIAQAFIPEIAFLAARIRRGKFVAHFHLDVVASGTFGFVFRLYKRTLFPQMLRRADKVLVFSEDQKKLVVKKYHVRADKVAILPNGIRRGFERAEPRTLHHPTRLLFVGRLSHQKYCTPIGVPRGYL